MVERRTCSFCGKDIEPGTGRMYVKKDGTVLYFCSSKCYKNMMELKRVPRRVTWTADYEKEKRIRTGAKDEKEEEKKPVKKKVRKVARDAGGSKKKATNKKKKE